MADLKKTVELLFGSRDVGVSKMIDNLNKKLGTLGKDMKDFGEPFQDAAEKIAAVTAAIAGIATAGIMASADLEKESLKMQASLGLPAEEARKFEAIAKDVYSAGYGDDLAGAFNAAIVAQKKFGDDSSEDIGKVTKRALELQKVFDVDYVDSMAAAKNLMKNFGITSDEAFGFIAKGYQSGIAGSGDFIESINEYSTQFKSGGATAEQFFSIMSSGFQEGMLGTDRAADTFKEFRVRIQDGSKTTADALKLIGIDNEAFQKNLTSGKMTAIEAFDVIVKKLNETKDSAKVMQAGVGLLGTQFEDMGTEAALALSTSTSKMEDFNKALSTSGVDDFGKQMTAAWRTVSLSFGDMEIWDEVKVKLSGVFSDIAEAAPEAFENVDFSGFIDSVDELWTKVGKLFSDADFDLTTVEGLQNAIQFVVDGFSSTLDLATGIVEALSPMVTIVIDIAKGFNDLDAGTKELLGNIIGIGVSVGIMGSAVSGALSAIGLMKVAVTVLGPAIGGIIAILTGPLGLAVGVGLAAAAVLNFSTSAMNTELEANRKKLIDHGTELEKVLKKMDELPPEKTLEVFMKIDDNDLVGASKLIDELIKEEKLIRLKTEFDKKGFTSALDALNSLIKDDQLIKISAEIKAAVDKGDISKAQTIFEKLVEERVVKLGTNIPQTELSKIADLRKSLDDMTLEQRIIGIRTGLDSRETDEFLKNWDTLSEKNSIELAVAINEGDQARAEEIVLALAEGREIPLTMKIDKAATDEAMEELEYFVDGVRKTILIPVDVTGIDKAKKEVESITGEKLFEIKLKGEIDKDLELIRAQAQTIQTAMEWTAKLNIESVIAQTAQLKAAFDSIAASVDSTADATSSMYGDYLKSMNDFESYVDKMDAKEMLEDQMNIQNKLVDAQIKLTNAQTAFLDLKRRKLREGTPMFDLQLDSSALEPGLELVFWHILDKVQARVSEEQAEFLMSAGLS